MVTQYPEHERQDATEEEIKELRHVVDSVSLAVWVALVANATERFTFYAVTTPWPFSHSQITKVVGLGFAMIVLGIGTAGVKATASPFIGDQYAEAAPQVISTKKGERVIADRALTLQYIYNVSYWFNWEAATPVYQSEKFGHQVEWDDKFVFEIKRGLQACKVMACFVPFHLCMNQITNNLVSQAGQMRLGGIPNDTIQALNSIACVLLGPIMQRFVYPIVRGRGFAFGPIARITWAFIMMSTAMAYAAGVQKLIYTKGPCYDKPLQCEKSPNDVSVWIQSPVYFLLGVAEILGFTTLAEYSYSEAPRNMRSLVQAMAQLSSGAGSALGMAFSPLSKDPQILYLYTGLSVTMITTAPTFWLMFRAYDDRVFEEEKSTDDGSNQAVEPMGSGPSDAAETGEKGDGAKTSA
ncbi:hypothetical protein J7337_002000 [Fusarium musae]|uniref:Uncharacterized protein n=1 Tax=Fusarium musae TaxID=1042133 RepID=A0A9P8DN57_9HYPO|nr:hypothetical protein J7337_002000 [Fusarium musae]KAG9505034.1 hypothetical protein J7337_002000 [Fusarium musae]